MGWLELIIAVILFFIFAAICIKLITIAFILMFAVFVCWLLWWCISSLFAYIGWWVILVIIIVIILIKK